VTTRPVEWDVLHPLDGAHVAVIRLMLLGPKREPFYRVVTPEPDRSRRQLLGYWGTLDEAHEAALALLEQHTGEAIEGGGRKSSRRVPPQKPPSPPYPTGVAARAVRG
jgi:ribosomal protein S16